jgi:hypothetical protein
MERQAIGVEGFLAGLTGCGVAGEARGGLVIFGLEAIDGAHRGYEIETAVEVDELTRWPAVPPHWIHLPEAVKFARTHSQPSTRPGFLRHSRQIRDWGCDADAAQAWLSHHRGVLGEAIA